MADTPGPVSMFRYGQGVEESGSPAGPSYPRPFRTGCVYQPRPVAVALCGQSHRTAGLVRADILRCPHVLAVVVAFLLSGRRPAVPVHARAAVPRKDTSAGRPVHSGTVARLAVNNALG